MERVGCAVSAFRPGDQVLLSYMSCGQCHSCQENHPAYCADSFSCNFKGEGGIYTTLDGNENSVGGSFFGQSSFSSLAVVKERSLVNLRGLDLSLEEMQILAPLGCGVQTGCGAIINVADVQPSDTVAVIGVGGVGQSAIMVSVAFAIYYCFSRLRYFAAFFG